jgi:hypothetical protein
VAVHEGVRVALHSYYAGTRPCWTRWRRSWHRPAPGFALLHLERFGAHGVDGEGLDPWEHAATHTVGKRLFRGVLGKGTPLSELYGTLCPLLAGTNFHYAPRDYTTDRTRFLAGRTRAGSSGALRVFQWVMTPGATDILADAVNPFAAGGLRTLFPVADTAATARFFHRDAVGSCAAVVVDHLGAEMVSRIGDAGRPARTA